VAQGDTAGHAGGGTSGLSIVVASRLSEGDEAACLAALAPQCVGAEVVLVRDAPAGPAVPWAQVHVNPGAMVPELWADGLRRAAGDVVAFLATTSIPDARFVADVVDHHRAGHLAVGGAIEPGPAMGAADWAVYFCRYAPYMQPIDDPLVEMAADNGSYRRQVLVEHGALERDAFLEPFVHADLRADGIAVTVQPRPVVHVTGGWRLRPFLRRPQPVLGTPSKKSTMPVSSEYSAPTMSIPLWVTRFSSIVEPCRS